MSNAEPTVHLYWGTGCTSCLRAKEFLERNDVSFSSHNVVEDKSILDEMAQRGLPQHVPIVRRGQEWADGKILEDVATLTGTEYDAEILSVMELYDRLEQILAATLSHIEQLPEDELETTIPNRPRTYADLIYHIFSIPESFLEHEAGIPHTEAKTVPNWDHYSTHVLSSYGQNVTRTLNDWFESRAETRDWSESADVYWGEQTMHQYLERTTWHAGQHLRQIEWVLTEELGIELEQPVSPTVWEGLPLPEKVWDVE